MGETSFEVAGEIAVFRMSGAHTLEEGVPQVTAAILRACELGVAKFLFEATQIELPVPGIGARHWFMTEWAKAARGRIRMAVVVRPEFIDPDRVGLIAARNCGMVGEVFDNEAAALTWLSRDPGL